MPRAISWRTMALCTKYCAKDTRGRAKNYEPWAIGSNTCLCHASSISWLDKSLRRGWMLKHILFLQASWLLEILFSFCSNYFYEICLSDFFKINAFKKYFIFSKSTEFVITSCVDGYYLGKISQYIQNFSTESGTCVISRSWMLVYLCIKKISIGWPISKM